MQVLKWVLSEAALHVAVLTHIQILRIFHVQKRGLSAKNKQQCSNNLKDNRSVKSKSQESSLNSESQTIDILRYCFQEVLSDGINI